MVFYPFKNIRTIVAENPITYITTSLNSTTYKKKCINFSASSHTGAMLDNC